MSSFFRSDDALTEPYSDLLAIGLVLTGFLIFLVLVGGAYSSYACKAYAMEHFSDVNFLAQKFKGLLGCDSREDLLDSGKLDRYQSDSKELLGGWNQRSGIQITVVTEERSWTLGGTPDFWTTRGSASIPVTVRINPAQSVEGTLMVTLWGE